MVPAVIPNVIPSAAPPTDSVHPEDENTFAAESQNQNIGSGPGTGPGNGPCIINCGEPGSGPPYPVGGNVRSPVGIYQPQPAYPHPALIARQQGAVILQAVIGTDGAVENLDVMKSVSPLLDDSALMTVRQWRYTPAMLNGRTVRVYLTVTVNFKLY